MIMLLIDYHRYKLCTLIYVSCPVNFFCLTRKTETAQGQQNHASWLYLLNENWRKRFELNSSWYMIFDSSCHYCFFPLLKFFVAEEFRRKYGWIFFSVLPSAGMLPFLHSPSLSLLCSQTVHMHMCWKLKRN